MAGIADLEAAGRNGDKHLVHMTTEELQGLQKLAMAHGGSLTINPKTGLYEASWLTRLLPTIAGVASNYFMPGNPWGAAAIGAGVGALTGNKRNGVGMNALLGGLGGYGGASLSSMFADAGIGAAASEGLAASMGGVAEAASGVAAEAGTGQLGSLGTASVGGMASDALGQAASGYIAPGLQAATTVGGLSPAVANAGNSIFAQGGDALGQAASGSTFGQTVVPRTGMERLGDAWRGVSQIPTNTWDTNKKYIKPGLAALSPLLASGMGGANGNTGALPGSPGYTGSIPQLAYNQTRNSNWNPERPWEEPYWSGQSFTRMAAQGGLMNLAQGGATTQPRMIKGAGDGLSDSVPAEIQGGQKAALADGEFVISSDVVSALGGGSTDAGARKLYAMMDRIRKQAHGTKKQVRKVNPRRALPA